MQTAYALAAAACEMQAARLESARGGVESLRHRVTRPRRGRASACRENGVSIALLRVSRLVRIGIHGEDLQPVRAALVTRRRTFGEGLLSGLKDYSESLVH